MIKKLEIYGNPASQKLICDIYKNAVITPAEVGRFYFSNYLEETELKKRSLPKLSKDFYDERQSYEKREMDYRIFSRSFVFQIYLDSDHICQKICC